MSGKPIKIVKNKIIVKLNYSIALRDLSKYMDDGVRYLHEKDIYWKNSEGKCHFIKKGSPKSLAASKIIDLRIQYSSFINDLDFDPIHNPIIGSNGPGLEDMEYQYHFVHRHGFPSDIRGPGRGQRTKVTDILKRPLSYMLMKSSDHEDYDRETGEWRNNQYQKNAS